MGPVLGVGAGLGGIVSVGGRLIGGGWFWLCLDSRVWGAGRVFLGGAGV